MLTLRVISKRHLPGVPSVCYQSRHFATKKKEKPKDIMADYKQKLPAAQPKKPKREPFVKNFFLGIVDTEFLAYPEPQIYDRYNEFQEWIQPLKEYMKNVNSKEFEETGEIPPRVLQNLRELGVFGTRIHEDYQGSNLLHSEFMQVLEVVSKVPALGVHLLKHSVPAIDIFKKYGTVEQKLKYLPKIAIGQSVATVAITEQDSGPGASKMLTTGTLDMSDEYWVIDGEKNFVSNAKHADVFVVLGHASLSGTMERRPETLTAFIVDRDAEGVHVAKDSIETTGLKGFDTGRIVLKGAKVPKANILGQIGDGAHQLVELFTNTRHFIAPITIGILRNFLELVVNDILNRKHFDVDLHDTEMVKRVIANVTSSIYSMESMLYMTTAMMDIYDDQDIQIETALTEQFCIQECLKCIQESTWLIGPRAATVVQPFEQIFRDTYTLINYESALLDTKIFTGLLGIQYCGLAMVGKVKKERNPLLNPNNVLMKLFSVQKNHLNLKMEQYLHPSLKECSEFCDRSLFLLKESTENLLILNGVAISDKHTHLARLSDMACLIYAYIANMSRTSRSYCIGNKDSDNEMRMSMIMSYRLEQRVKQLAEDIKVSEYANGDFLGNEVADLTFERKKYIAAHPLQRNY